MKKQILSTLIVLTMLSISSLSFAATHNKGAGISYLTVEGTIVSIDKAKNLFAVKDKDDGRVYGFMTWASDISSLSQGDHVVVTKEQPGAIALKITR